MFRRILVPTDFSPPAKRAADYAVRLAEGLGAELVLVHVFAFPYDWYYWEEPELDALRHTVEASAERKLRALAARLARPGVAVRTHLALHSNVRQAIQEAAEEEQADLIVMGTKGWTGERPELGSVAEQVTRYSPRPVLMVDRDAATRSVHPRVLVPVDLSDTAAAALKLGVALAAALDGRVDVVHVLPDLPFQAEFLGDEPVDADEPLSSEQRAREVEEFLREQGGSDAPAEVYLAEGDMVEETARYAIREQADLVVLGISGQDRMHKAERLALAAPCPVLAVPTSEGQRAPAPRPAPPTPSEAVLP